MRIISNSLQPNNNVKKTPSFRATLVVTPSAKKVLEHRLAGHVFKGKSFNCEELLAAYKEAFEKATQEIKDGTVKIFKSKRFKNHLALDFIFPEDKALKRKSSGYKFNPKDFPRNEHGVKNAVIQTIAQLADIMARKGFGYEEKNQFAQLLYRLLAK